MRIVGIDPGVNGGIAFLDDHGAPQRPAGAYDLPIIRDKSLSWIDGLQLTRLLEIYAPNKAVIERVSAMPAQGVSSSFHFGMAFGSILSILQAQRIPIELVTPAVWKRDMKLGNDKKASLHKARLIFPTVDLKLEKSHNKAEALLIAMWYFSKTQPRHDAATGESYYIG